VRKRLQIAAPGMKLLLFLAAAPLFAQDGLVQAGFDHFYNLEYEQAIAAFTRAAAADPASPAVHNHVAQAILFQELFRHGALESDLVSGSNSFLRRPRIYLAPETERRFLDEVGRAIALAEERLRAARNDTATLYALGVSYGLRSNYNWLVRKSWYDALRDASAARRIHQRVTVLDPSNVDARLVQGLHDYIVGSLPWSWRTVGALAGIRGDKAGGIRIIEDVARRGDANRVTAAIVLCALYRRENRPRDAVPVISGLIARFPRNFLFRLELSQMYSLAGETEQALAAIDEVSELKRTGAPGFERLPWEKIRRHEAAIRLRAGERTRSRVYHAGGW
jgi:tetratricopeptide (TPR) repeat protein